MASKTQCKFGKACNKMASCTFEHVCPYFKSSAGCKFGEGCRNLHKAVPVAGHHAHHGSSSDYVPEAGQEYLADPDRLAYAAAAADDPSLLGEGESPGSASPAALAEMKRRIDARFAQAVSAIEAAHRVALCFVLDTTGSMKEQMKAVKNQVTDIVKKLKEDGCDLQHIAFVGYKDWSDGDDHYEILRFTPNIQAFVEFVDRIKAGGGGDTPEDVLGGLLKAALLDWPEESGCRVLFHLGDAPPHGKIYYGGSDEYPKGHPQDPMLPDLFARFKDKGITYYFGELNDLCKKMKEMFSKAAGRDVSDIVFDNRALSSIAPAVTNAARRAATAKTAAVRMAKPRPHAGAAAAAHVGGHPYAAAHHPAAHHHAAAEGPRPAAASAAAAGPPKRPMTPARPVKLGEIDLSGAGGPGSGLTYAPDGAEVQRKFTLVEARPSEATMDRLPELAGMVLAMDIPENFDFLRLNKTLPISTKGTSVRVAPHPFATGSIRLAYYGRSLFRKGGDMSVKPDEDDIVLKEYMTLATSPQLDLARYIVDLETQTVSAMMAFSYYKALAKALGRDPPFKVKYLKTHVVAFTESGHRFKRIMSSEKLFRDGVVMVKYTNNYNAVNWDGIGVPADMDKASWRLKVEFLVALSHFSWEASHQQLLVSDLQGIEAKGGAAKGKAAASIVLTDPAVHCLHENRFGVTNLRKLGIIGFFSTHKCNQFCKALNLSGSS